MFKRNRISSFLFEVFMTNRRIGLFSTMLLLISMSLIACGGGGGGAVGTGAVAPTVMAQASRTNGVAPLSVQFNADLSSDQSFSDNEYVWDFGDISSGIWGTNGESRNSAKGPVSAHVFEKPGTYVVKLHIRNASGNVGDKTFTITVDDPDIIYAGTKTICVSASGDFSGAPAGALQKTTGDLSTIAPLAKEGTRILFHRGESWTTAGLTNWPENNGPVTLGAYGAGTSPDALGIYGNAPLITVTSGTFLPMDSKQDWRIMDLTMIDPSRSATSMGGAMEMQRWLFLRLKIKGFSGGLGWSRWNTSKLMTIKEMAVVSCDISDSDINAMFVGGEQLALLGNKAYDARISHVVRVYTSYIGVISNNEFSGASLDNTNGRHALKLHGAKETELAPAKDNGDAAHRSQFNVISENTFGGSGPLPINIAPQDSGSDERLSYVVFERNRYHADFGSQNRRAQFALHIVAQHVTVRNNIFDGSNAATDFVGILVEKSGPAPAPIGTEIYNNTIFRSDNGYGNNRIGIQIGADPTATIIKNNLVSFPGALVPLFLINSASSSVTESNNLITSTPAFVDAYNASPLLRNFRQSAGSPGINQGVAVPVYDDFGGAARTSGIYDIGAFNY